MSSCADASLSEDDGRLLVADGERVHVSVATGGDIAPYREAMTRSASRIGRWNPVNPDDLVHHLAAQSATHRTFLIRAKDAARVTGDEAGLVGCVNVTNVVHGRFMSATMGYNAFDPYVGTGLFREGMALVVGTVLRQAPQGMGLHRLEANVRIGNDTSAGLLRSLGFRRERTMRRMLWLADGLGGRSAWFDHDSFAVTREEWPAATHAANDLPTGVIVCGSGTPAAAAFAVARELGGVALADVPFDAALTTARYAAAPVVWLAGDDAEAAHDALLRAGATVARGDDIVASISGNPSDVTRAALRLRPRLV